MLKRFFVALAMLAGLLSPAYSAGTVPGFSLTPQYDLTGHIAPGCKLYVIQAGTTNSPQIAYQDSGLTLPVAGGSTVTCDATGRLPQFFLADGSIKFRLTTSGGTQIFSQDGLIVVGASSGGGGGSPVDATTVLATGDIKTRYGAGALSGFVRANARTIGSATSGATERANADCQALFEYLWNTDANLAVSTGRGVSANADWVANKQLTLPDWRGRALAGLADMGNSVTTALTAAGFGNTVTTLGAAGGSQTFALAAANMAPHTHNGSGTTGNENANHTHSGSGTTGNENADHTHSVSGVTGAENQSHTHTTAGILVSGASGSGITSAGVSASLVNGSLTSGAELQQHNHNFSATSAGISNNHQHFYSFTTAIESAVHQHAFSFTTDSGLGASQAFPTVTPTMLATIYLKL